MDTWPSGYMSKWLHRYVAAWIRGYVATLIRAYIATCPHGYKWLHSYMAAWLSGYMAAWLRYWCLDMTMLRKRHISFHSKFRQNVMRKPLGCSSLKRESKATIVL